MAQWLKRSFRVPEVVDSSIVITLTAFNVERKIRQA